MVRTKNLKNYSDIHFTREDIAKKVVSQFDITLPCLEPCVGSGVFLKALPAGTQTCEITEGKDFFEFYQPVKWIVTNPPFEELTRWMEHSFALAENVVFLIPLSKLFSSAPRMRLVHSYGGICKISYLGSGRSIGFDIGFPFGAVHFQKNYHGPIVFSWLQTDY